MSEKVQRERVLGSPDEIYLAILDSAEQVRQLEQGLGSQNLRLFAAAEDQEPFGNLEVERLEDGGKKSLLRRVFAADEVETEQHYRDALRQGSYVVQVAVAEDDQTRRNEVEGALLEQGARFIHYYGRLTFEEVVADKDRSEE